MTKQSRWSWMVAALVLLVMVLPAQASLTNLVSIAADSVSLDPSVLLVGIAAGAVLVIGGGIAIALGVRLAKWIFRVVMGFLGKA